MQCSISRLPEPTLPSSTTRRTENVLLEAAESCSQIKSSLNVPKVYMNLQCYNQASPLLMEFITFKLSPISANNKPQEMNNSKFQEGTKN